MLRKHVYVFGICIQYGLDNYHASTYRGKAFKKYENVYPKFVIYAKNVNIYISNMKSFTAMKHISVLTAT